MQRRTEKGEEKKRKRKKPLIQNKELNILLQKIEQHHSHIFDVRVPKLCERKEKEKRKEKRLFF